MATPSKTLLGIDWGTSNRRAYLIDRDGRCLAQRADGYGMLAVNGAFGAALAALRQDMNVGPDVPTVMSGMVGSASGWQEVPYLNTAIPLAQLPAHLVPVAGSPSTYIVPGYCDRSEAVDVMRGEEAQLLGAVAMDVTDGWVVLPGTHSKWVRLTDGKITQLATYMTGELFAMLSAGGTLSALMAAGEEDATAFAAGLLEAQLGRALSNTLFGVRARVVAKVMPAAAARSFVSGLLIGTEFTNARQQFGEEINIIAAPALSRHYASAAERFGMAKRVLDPDQIFCAALARLLKGFRLEPRTGHKKNRNDHGICHLPHSRQQNRVRHRWRFRNWRRYRLRLCRLGRARRLCRPRRRLVNVPGGRPDWQGDACTGVSGLRSV